jgi:hypothetical protein
MSNVIYVRPRLEGASRYGDAEMTAQAMRGALVRLLANARGEGMENTAMTLELALTAIDVDLEERRAS